MSVSWNTHFIQEGKGSQLPLSIIFWVIMVVVAIFGAGFGFMSPNPNHRYGVGAGFVVFVLLFLLGWKVFGFVVQNT